LPDPRVPAGSTRPPVAASRLTLGGACECAVAPATPQIRVADRGLDDNARKKAARRADEFMPPTPIEGMFWDTEQWGITQ